MSRCRLHQQNTCQPGWRSRPRCRRSRDDRCLTIKSLGHSGRDAVAHRALPRGLVENNSRAIAEHHAANGPRVIRLQELSRFVGALEWCDGAYRQPVKSKDVYRSRVTARTTKRPVTSASVTADVGRRYHAEWDMRYYNVARVYEVSAELRDASHALFCFVRHKHDDRVAPCTVRSPFATSGPVLTPAHTVRDADAAVAQWISYYLPKGGGYVFVSIVCCLFVFQQGCEKLLNRFSRNLNLAGKVVHGPRNKPLDYVGNPGHVTLGLGFGYRVGVTVRSGHRHTRHGRMCYLAVVQ